MAHSVSKVRCTASTTHGVIMRQKSFVSHLAAAKVSKKRHEACFQPPSFVVPQRVAARYPL